MALRKRIGCDTCGEQKDIMYDPARPIPTTCDNCKQIAEEKEKLDFLSNLRELPETERLARIEEWIYDHSRKFHPHKPIRL